MKKSVIKKISLFCSMLVAASCFAVFGAACSDAGKKDGARLKVGLISDPHCITTTSWNGSLVKTFNYFKEQDVDAIVIAGDITDIANTANYGVYNKAVSSVFERLLAAGQRLIGVIKKNEGRPNKELAKFADQINSLCDKWDN